MSDYQAVTKALQNGADPTMICRTCPWTRQCITPPEMTAADVQDALDKAREPDPHLNGDAKDKAMNQLMGTLLTSVLVGGADTRAQVCPVFATRLREETGRQIAEGIRQTMIGWVERSPSPSSAQ